MRTREDIEADVNREFERRKNYRGKISVEDATALHTIGIFEVLLDIRDLLAAQKEVQDELFFE